jgi:hypothetical protein
MLRKAITLIILDLFTSYNGAGIGLLAHLQILGYRYWFGMVESNIEKATIALNSKFPSTTQSWTLSSSKTFQFTHVI